MTENNQEPGQPPVDPEAQAFSKEIVDNVRKALLPLREQYGEMLNDFAVVLNWKEQYAEKPYPRLVVDPIQPPPPGDIQRPMVLSDLLNMASRRLSHEVIQMLMYQRAETDKQLVEALNENKEAEGTKETADLPEDPPEA